MIEKQAVNPEDVHYDMNCQIFKGEDDKLYAKISGYTYMGLPSKEKSIIMPIHSFFSLQSRIAEAMEETLYYVLKG